MKRIMACVLALMLLCCAALGEAGSFSFRNGVVWGMTEDEALAAEGREEWDYDWTDSNGNVEYYLQTVPVAGELEAKLGYTFSNDQLIAAIYDFYDFQLRFPETDIVQPLTDALTVKYGSPEGPDEATMVEMVCNMEGSDPETVAAFDSYTSWALEDDTWIALVVLNDKSVQLVYLDSAAISRNAPLTLTTEGL